MIAEYSKTGSRHNRQGLPNQDSIRTAADDRYTAVALADGVSTCSMARTGAEIAAEAATMYLRRNGPMLFEMSEKGISGRILGQALENLEQQAEKDDLDVKEYSCTLSAALFDSQRRKMLCFNLGDALILGSDGNQCRVFAHPASTAEGCCTVTTKNAIREAETKILDCAGLKHVYIFSDGAWQLMAERNRLKPAIRLSLLSGNAVEIRSYLDQAANEDDASFITINLQ